MPIFIKKSEKLTQNMNLACLMIATLGVLTALVAPVRAQGQKIGYSETGWASYYPGDEANRPTLSGETYDMKALEVAHRHIAFGAVIKVTNLENDRVIYCRVNDRPNTTERIMDMTLAAADSLGMLVEDKAQIFVKVQIVALGVPRMPNPRVHIEGAKSTKATDKKAEGVAKTDTKATTTQTKQQPVDKQAQKTANSDVVKTEPKKEPKSEPKKDIKKDVTKPAQPKTEMLFAEAGTYNIAGQRRQPLGYGLQIGYFSELKTALKEAKEAEALKLGAVYIQTVADEGQYRYRVLVGDFAEKAQSQDALKKLNAQKYQAFTRKYNP